MTAPVTAVGRVEDNAFQIPEPSVSSHHCEFHLRGSDVVIKDLNSTNGTFINGQELEGEAVLKPGQIVRLGQVEVRLEGATLQGRFAALDASGALDLEFADGRHRLVTAGDVFYPAA